MPMLVRMLYVVLLTGLLLWLIYHTSLGVWIGAIFPDAFWLWLYDGSKGLGAEIGYDLELLVFTLLPLSLSISAVSILNRWLTKGGG